MAGEKYKKEFNLMAKRIYRNWLLDTIKNKDYESFKECVLNLGSEWHATRGVKKEVKEKVAKHLWDVYSEIQSGTYVGWANSMNGTYSYESKVCFLINPKKYKLIYDGNNRKGLHRFLGNWYKPQEWQDAADEYYKKIEKNVQKMTEEEIFETDFELWNQNRA